MQPVTVSPDVTAFVSSELCAGFFGGFVNILEGPEARRYRHDCVQVRGTEEEALRDAEVDAEVIVKLWRHTHSLP
jgi:hypothetical protein